MRRDVVTRYRPPKPQEPPIPAALEQLQDRVGVLDHPLAEDERYSWVYFLAADVAPRRVRVKIGTTVSLLGRMKSIMAMCPVSLRLEAVECFETRADARWRETCLHRQFRYLRSYGEWFDGGPELMRLIHTVRGHFDPRRPVAVIQETNSIPLADLASDSIEPFSSEQLEAVEAV